MLFELCIVSDMFVRQYFSLCNSSQAVWALSTNNPSIFSVHWRKEIFSCFMFRRIFKWFSFFNFIVFSNFVQFYKFSNRYLPCIHARTHIRILCMDGPLLIQPKRYYNKHWIKHNNFKHLKDVHSFSPFNGSSILCDTLCYINFKTFKPRIICAKT